MTALPLAAALLLAQAPAPPPRTLHVSGEGRAFAAPDVARVTVGVEARDPGSLARASAAASARMKNVLASIEKGGVAPKDVRTVSYDVEVERSYEKSSVGKVIGYRVSSQVVMTVRDLARLGSILDRVVAAGSNAIGGLVFEKGETSSERARALEGAVADARAKAEVLAKAAGATLGEVLVLSESTPGAIPILHEGFVARANRAVPVATGQLELAASVEVTFGLR
jgi:hypothetical protein